MASEVRLLGRLLLLAVVVLSAFRFASDVGAIAREPFADFPIFLHAAERARDGGELYEKKADPAHYEPNAPVYKYPPLYAALLRPFCGDDPAAVARGHLALLLALLAATVVLLVRQTRLRSATTSTAAAATLLAVLHSGPLYETLRGLQLELPILFLLALAAWAAVRGRERTLGAALGAAALLKIYPAFLLLPLVVVRRRRALAAFAVVALLLGAAGLATAGAAENRFYWLDLLPRLLGELPARKLENVSIACFLMERGGLDPAAAKQAARWIVLPLVALAIGALLRLRRLDRDDGADRDRTAGLDFAVAVPLMLLAMPNSWLDYQLLLLLPIATLLRLGLAPGAPRWPAVAALLAMVPLAFTGDSALVARHAPWPDAFTLRMVELRLASPLLLLAAALACCARAQPAAAPER